MIRQLRARELAELRARPGDEAGALVVLDVREPWELEICRLPGAHAIPMRQVPARLSEIDRAATVVCLCHHGGRSQQVAAFLAANGFGSVMNLAGGIDAWSREVDPTVPTY